MYSIRFMLGIAVECRVFGIDYFVFIDSFEFLIQKVTYRFYPKQIR